MKRKDHALEAGSAENEDDTEDLALKREEKVGKKSVTKAAVAKRIIKKKIVANKKTVFDEEGTVCFLLQSSLLVKFHSLIFV
jgi:ATP-dependent RNA helicase DDX10/DBP4